MKKIIIFGTGKGAEIVRKCLKNEVEITGYLDNICKEDKNEIDNKPIVYPYRYREIESDYIVISSLKYNLLRKQLEELGVKKEKVISFFDYENVDFNRYGELFDCFKATFASYKQNMDVQMQKMKMCMESRMCNMEYEIADRIRKQNYSFPIIESGANAIEKIVKEHKSITRFGDGEFEIILGRERPRFQKTDLRLGERLKEILTTKENGILVGIANNYGSLDRFEDKCADDIRSYLTPEIRKEHMNLIDINKVYYDAYVTRPYLLFKDKESAKTRFNQIKEIWDKRDVVIIEGYGTRMGYQNNLLDNAESIQRILCPSENAWSKYEEILKAALMQDKTKLILLSLGPTATVLAFDLYKSGYQAIDIGHIDNEYEWYLRKAKNRENIEYKYVNEFDGGNIVTSIHSNWYERQIICKIE